MNERISLTMIVRNGSAHLADCLESVKDKVDEIIIVDTGSTDDTFSIAQRYTPHVYSFSWHNDFSAARNFAIEHASGDWILALDADEKVQCQDLFDFHSVINKEKDKEAFLLPLLNPISVSTEEYNTFYVLRLSYYSSAQSLTLVALSLLGDFLSAKSLAITLWKNQSTRCAANVFLGLFNLCKSIQFHHTSPKYEKKKP